MSWAAALPEIARYAAALVLAAGTVVLAAPRAIAALAAAGQRQRIREDAPGRHQDKAGTPTMGGLLMIAATTLAALVVAGPDARVLFGLAVLAGFGAIGLIDDLRAIRLGRNLGLRARERLALQAGLALALGAAATVVPGTSSVVAVPGVGPVDLGRAYIVVAALLVMGFANAVNLTDGLDGLAATLVLVAAGGFLAIAVARDQPTDAVLAAALAGACAGFLPFNRHPARVFMGDVGSNALGAALAALAILARAEAALFVIGGVFTAEAASVFLQVAYFRATGGRRIFRMSPLHHHFELVGWSEPAIVRRFVLAGGVCLVLGLMVALP
ncbi:MAG: phospho-N-acetylmuramoyl-pentapeptide-transferase [Armatimonadota bacterium]|nr:phospho-N-acetylmuramoyl-pentapeptide-transferase [Armatimonadota bacterium]MDR7455055.1 phospho-N-acetylmuramoyl-pentapeptide-transferase [Armatimonadota bacterium]MDR7458085.1 phospho-N-acetylmuramoyl-pentapeptide-transferase [Armatimonadota bacterium]MDR7495632.1 phospho-N-acetylmuramoyl-pentapeptide-transferase [Armatimonadota bacterium]MDR7513039.1 phospho-N-acetylmuramoyl-pentapeptide-transferase [Armatimonadota bacterium]